MGKSSSGKDTIYKKMLQDSSLELHTIVPCTTRPIRSGETHGVEYFFYTEEELQKLEHSGKIIELRTYDTIHGIWKYFTADDGQINLQKYNYLMIGTLDSYRKMQQFWGFKALIPIYIEVDDGLRLQRALDRERIQEEPKYSEMCRRFLADEMDFSEDRLAEAGITRRFQNKEITDTVKAITSYIKDFMENS